MDGFNSVDVYNSKVDITEERNSELEDRWEGNTHNVNRVVLVVPGSMR